MADFPSSPGFRRVDTRIKHYHLMSESINGRIQVRSLNSNRRYFTLVFPPMTRAEFDPIHDFINTKEGPLTTFTIDIPDPDQATFETVVHADSMVTPRNFLLVLMASMSLRLT